jgi:DNA-binding CsgD family transcriptional regulator
MSTGQGRGDPGDPIHPQWSDCELSSRGLRVVVEVGRIGSLPGRADELAPEMLEPLRRVIPYDGAFLALRDPDTDRFVPVVSSGYDDATQAYRLSAGFQRELELVGLHRTGPPLRLCDSPVPAAETRIWAEHLTPAGYREGIGTSLFTSDGRRLGMLSLHTESAAHPTDEARVLVGVVAPVIANAIDPMRSLAALARMVADARAGIVLTGAGETLPLPGLPGHPVLRAGTDVLAAARESLADGLLHASFLCACGGRDGFPFIRVTALACPQHAAASLRAVVLVSPPGDLHGLTPRELEIVGLLVDGWPNLRIAAALFVTERTVAAHVEHILLKLGAHTRTLAAVRAVRRGLYVPHSLISFRNHP